jgi:hypothetical protein
MTLEIQVLNLGQVKVIILTILYILQQHKIWTCLEYCISRKPLLLKNRHLDQVTIYIVDKHNKNCCCLKVPHVHYIHMFS